VIGNVLMNIMPIHTIAISVARGAEDMPAVDGHLFEDAHLQAVRFQLLARSCTLRRNRSFCQLKGSGRVGRHHCELSLQ
jgi:hypothetical protein